MKESPRLSSLVIYSTDVPKALEYYTSLGINFTEEKHGDGPVHYAAELGEGGVLIEIYPGDKPTRIGFQVDSVDDVVKELGEKEISPDRPTKDSPYGRFTTLKDPDGRTVELRQPPTA